MKTSEQGTSSPLQTTSTSRAPAVVPLQQTSVLPSHTNYVKAAASVFLCFSMFILSFRVFEQLLLPLYSIVVPRPEIMRDGDIAYTPFAWFAMIKRMGISRNTFSLDARDSLHSIPAFIADLPRLKYISIMHQPIRSLPDSIGSQTNVGGMTIINNSLTTLPASIGNLTNIEFLSLQGNQLTSLPDSLGNLKNLRALNLAYNHLSSLPPSLASLPHLEFLDITGNNFHSFPTNLPASLKALFIGGNPLSRKVIEDNSPGTRSPGFTAVYY